MGNKLYHGRTEIMKTDRLLTEQLAHIKGKCRVLKMKDYIKESKVERAKNNLFVTRRFYDSEKNIYRPETMEQYTYQGKVLNPDDNIIACLCQRLYPVESLTEDSSICDNCGINMFNNNSFNQEFERLKADTGAKESMITLKGKNSEFNFGSIKTQNLKEGRNQATSRRLAAKKLFVMNDKKRKDIDRKIAQKASQLLKTF